MTQPRDEVLHDLTGYVVNDLLQDPTSQLEPTSLLLEWGVLNSMNIARLITHIHSRHGVAVPPQDLVGGNFKDLNAITDLVMRLMAAAH